MEVANGPWKVFVRMDVNCYKEMYLLQADQISVTVPDGLTEDNLQIPDAIDACISNSDGFFAFDLCHVKKYDYWNAFKTGFDKYLESIEE